MVSTLSPSLTIPSTEGPKRFDFALRVMYWMTRRDPRQQRIHPRQQEHRQQSILVHRHQLQPQRLALTRPGNMIADLQAKQRRTSGRQYRNGFTRAVILW